LFKRQFAPSALVATMSCGDLGEIRGNDMLSQWIVLLLCGWLTATVSGTAGFGGALLLLPILAITVGGKDAVPILTVAQLLGNVSRAGFGWRGIRWRPVLIFSAGAVPASIIGARLFVDLPSVFILKLIGVVLLLIVALRHTTFCKYEVPESVLAPTGAVVGFLSAIVGSAGPLGAAVFLSLHLPPPVYVSSEAVTAVFMHLTKTITYGRYAAITFSDFVQGIVLGGSLVVGSWTGRMLIGRMPEKSFSVVVEILLVVSAMVLIIGRT
jgi:uncharacterized protein